MTDLALIHDDMTLEQVLDTMSKVDFIYEQAKAQRASNNEALIEWIQEHGAFESNGNLYSVGKTKSVKCVDVAGCLEALLGHLDGDFAEFVQLLAAQPIKPGAAKKVLGETAYFKTTFKDKIVLKKIPISLLTQGP